MIHQWIFLTVLGNIPYIIILQYIASGALGISAFEGGMMTALLGLIFHVFISFVIAGVYLLSVQRIPLLCQYPIPAALLYGFVAWVVMNMVVTPLSAAPPPDPALTTPQIIEMIIDHILVIGLPLGILVQRSINSNK